MRKRVPGRRDAIRKSAVIVTLFATAILIGILGFTLTGSGSTYQTQDPAPPASPPYVSLVPDNLDFGNQVARRTSAAKTITVKNTGGQPLNIDSVTLGGDNPNSFAILKDTCTGATVDPNRACVVSVTFTPSGTGGRNANLRLNDNAPDSPQRLKLKGNGINSSAVPPF